MLAIADDLKKRPSRTSFYKAFAFMFIGAWLLHEATAFGVLLSDENAWIYFPLCLMIMWIAELIHVPQLFWGALFFVFPLGGLYLFINGCVIIIRSLAVRRS